MIAAATCAKRRISCSIANSRRDRKAAFQLLHECYVNGGLGEANQYGMRVTPFHLVPTTDVFVARVGAKLISTVSVVKDGDLGLPMEMIYGAEVQERRDRGLSLGEVTCLANVPSDRRQFFNVFCELNRLMIQYARSQRLDQVLITVHPKHARFYERNLGFRKMAGLRCYPCVLNKPAVALCYDFVYDRLHPCRYHDTFFDQPLSDAELEPRPMDEADKTYFGRMVDESFMISSMNLLSATA